MCADHLLFRHVQLGTVSYGERSLLSAQIHCRADKWKTVFFTREPLMLVHECLFAETVLFFQ